ncbi:NFX1-type zinc finger-containing protein 1-like [Amblyomma americanum]
MHRSTQQSGSASATESFSSTSTSTSDEDDDLSMGAAFRSRRPRFGHEPVAKMATVQPGCRDLVRPGRNCHTYSKGAGFSLSNDGDSSVGSASKSRSWRHVSRNVDVATLSRLLDSSETEVLFALVLMGHNLDALLENAALDCAALDVVLALLVKACMCRRAEHLRLLLGAVAANDRFLRNVEQQLVCRRRLPVFWDQFIVPLVTVLEKAVQLLPREVKTGLCGVAAALLDLVNTSLQDTQPVDAKIVEAVESIGTHLAEANKLGFRRPIGRGPDASFPGDGDGEEKTSTLPADFIQSANLTETAEVGSARPGTTADYLSLQYRSLRELFLAPLRRVLTTLQSYPAPADAGGFVMYTRVKIGPPICTLNGVGYKVNFSVVDSRGCESRLLPGCMVCVSNDGFQTIFLGTVIWRSFKDRQRGHMVASFFEHRRLEALAPVRGFVMIECPEFYEDYASVFAAMKQFETEQLQMPFRRYIIERRSDVTPPGYMNNNTVFDVKALFQKSVFVRPHKDRDWPGSEESVLDRYQYDAVQTAVSRAVTLVEGMPGTGKTFMTTRLISVMLDNRDVSYGGPVLVVSKDKESLSSLMAHFEGALDDVEVVTAESDLFQITRQLLPSGPKSKVVESTALRLLRRHVDELEYLKARARTEQDILRCTPSRLLGESELKSVMSDKHYKSLFFTMATGAEDKLRDWLLADNEDVASRFSAEHHSSLSDEEVCYISDVWELDMESRYRLYDYWRDTYYDRKSREWADLVERFKTLLSLKKEVEEKLQFDALSTPKIVGATISSLQKVWSSLKDIRPQMIIVKEARSVPEPFMFPIIALNPHHIVLISDTQNIFDVLENSGCSQGSLFDRLVKQGVACCQLLGQYQLSPQTVRILEAFKTKTLLERYELHSENSDVRGVSTGVRFVNHSHCYERDIIIACAVEAEFVASLARYLLLQGYRAYQITVYAPTTDQVELIKSNLCGLDEEPLVTTVDKAKGCKNEIVLMSFSCPNTTYDIELSSGDHYQAIASSTRGLYCVGNMTYLEEHSRTWKQVAPVLHSEGLVGPLELTCQLHPEKKTAVSKAKEFSGVLDGGCPTPCDAVLPCGHPCPRTCHLTDRDHQEIACTKPCKKLLPCDHPCKATCGEPCPAECGVMVNVLSPCDHVVRVPCSAVLSAHEVRSRCTEVCGKKICRGVRCERTCRDCFLEGTHLSDDVYFEEEPSTCSRCRVM